MDSEKEVSVSSIAYQQLVVDASQRVRSGQLAAFRAVNKELIELYWDLGKMILERQQQYGWGKSIVESLSKDLQKEFPALGGLSSTNLWRMRAFYVNYGQNEQNEFLPPLVGEIGWTHNYIILENELVY
jgi:predicted nuclease of restriction endonuclease-like (RecB) superfamily